MMRRNGDNTVGKDECISTMKHNTVGKDEEIGILSSSVGSSIRTKWKHCDM
jgi:hypothetical protein